MASLDELDQVIRERLVGTPSATLRTLAGTLYRRAAGGTINYIGTVGNMGQLGTVLLTVHVGTVHKIDRIGTLDEITTIGSVAKVGSIGGVQFIGSLSIINWVTTVDRLNKLGSITRLTSAGTVQANLVGGAIGTQQRLNYVNKLGTIQSGHLNDIGTVPISSRFEDYSILRNNVRLGAGSTWVGSWQYIGSYQTKTFLLNVGNPGTSGGGSISLVAGLYGTGIGQTGTYYGPTRIGKGTFDPITFTEVFRYARPVVRMHGNAAGDAVNEHGGTVGAFMGLRA